MNNRIKSTIFQRQTLQVSAPSSTKAFLQRTEHLKIFNSFDKLINNDFLMKFYLTYDRTNYPRVTLFDFVVSLSKNFVVMIGRDDETYVD